MNKIKGIYAASMSVINSDLSLNIEKTVDHAEKIIDQGCHGAAIFGSTGQAQLISISEKINLLNQLIKSKYKDKYLIGTGLNSLNETINLMKVSSSLNFNNFLIMPPAYYKYGDKEVIEFYSRLVKASPDSRIILLIILLFFKNCSALELSLTRILTGVLNFFEIALINGR